MYIIFCLCADVHHFKAVVFYGCVGSHSIFVQYAFITQKIMVTIFTHDSIYAIARICHGNSVCPSHGWISQKRLKLGSRNFHHTVAPSL